MTNNRLCFCTVLLMLSGCVSSDVGKFWFPLHRDPTVTKSAYRDKFEVDKQICQAYALNGTRPPSQTNIIINSPVINTRPRTAMDSLNSGINAGSRLRAGVDRRRAQEANYAACMGQSGWIFRKPRPGDTSLKD